MSQYALQMLDLHLNSSNSGFSIRITHLTAGVRTEAAAATTVAAAAGVVRVNSSSTLLNTSKSTWMAPLIAGVCACWHAHGGVPQCSCALMAGGATRSASSQMVGVCQRHTKHSSCPSGLACLWTSSRCGASKAWLMIANSRNRRQMHPVTKSNQAQRHVPHAFWR
jgi:hypothetical protein